MQPIAITKACQDRLADLTNLFDDYRVFYGQSSDKAAAGDFLAERFRLGDSVVLIADADGGPVGFTQLYPSYSSVAMKRVWILNDLFVSSGARRRGVGKLLLKAAAEHAQQTDAVRLALATAHDNAAAKQLYEGSGWSRDEHFVHFSYAVPSG